MVEVLHEALRLEGLQPGTRIPRDKWELIVMDTMGVGSEKSIYTYTRMGIVKGFWGVVEAHGRGGRGYIIFAPTAHSTSQEDPEFLLEESENEEGQADDKDGNVLVSAC